MSKTIAVVMTISGLVFYIASCILWYQAGKASTPHEPPYKNK